MRFPEISSLTNRLNPVALKVQDLYPAAQIDTPFANFSTFGTNPVNQYEYDIKIDHNFSASDKISARFSRRQNDSDQPTAFGRTAGGPAPGTLGPGFSHTPGRQAVLNYVHVFSPSMTNNLNLGWFQVYPKRTIPGYGVISESSLGITGMPNADEKVGMPYFNFVNYHALGATTDTLFLELQASNSLTDVFSMIRGKHNIRIGGEARHLRIDNLQPGAQTTAWYFSNLFTDQRGFANTGFDYASFLLGLPNDMNYSLFPDYIRSRSSVYALFVQDDIRRQPQADIESGTALGRAPLVPRSAQSQRRFRPGQGSIPGLRSGWFSRHAVEQQLEEFRPSARLCLHAQCEVHFGSARRIWDVSRRDPQLGS